MAALAFPKVLCLLLSAALVISRQWPEVTDFVARFYKKSAILACPCVF